MTLVTIDQLRHDVEQGIFHTEVGLNGERVRATIASGAAGDRDRLAARLNQVLDWAARSTVPLNGCADELLAVYNQDWVDDDHPPLTKEQFRRRLSLIEVWISTDDSVELTYRDGGMFQGHDVLLELDADLTPGEASLEG